MHFNAQHLHTDAAGAFHQETHAARKTEDKRGFHVDEERHDQHAHADAHIARGAHRNAFADRGGVFAVHLRDGVDDQRAESTQWQLAEQRQQRHDGEEAEHRGDHVGHLRARACGVTQLRAADAAGSDHGATRGADHIGHAQRAELLVGVHCVPALLREVSRDDVGLDEDDGGDGERWTHGVLRDDPWRGREARPVEAHVDFAQDGDAVFGDVGESGDGNGGSDGDED